MKNAKGSIEIDNWWQTLPEVVRIEIIQRHFGEVIGVDKSAVGYWYLLNRKEKMKVYEGEDK